MLRFFSARRAAIVATAFGAVAANSETSTSTPPSFPRFSELQKPSFFVPRGDWVPVSFADIGNVGDGDGGKCRNGCLRKNSVAEAAAKAGPAVVNISAVYDLYGGGLVNSQGSGTIIDADGTILTCAHVLGGLRRPRIIDPNLKIIVCLQDGSKFEALVVNVDYDSDIAVLKINSKNPLPSAKLGSSSKLRQGDWVIAMGCPLSLSNTITLGIISNVQRKVMGLGRQGELKEYLQFDCAINEGNSGGPLVNLDGEIVGINQFKVHNSDGLSFAAPIDSVLKIVERFKKHTKTFRPWLGLKMLELNDMNISQLKDRNTSFPDITRGILVVMVTPGSPADRAGFQAGDVVVSFGGCPVESVKETVELMEDKVGKPLDVVVKRKNNVLETLTVVPEFAETS